MRNKRNKKINQFKVWLVSNGIGQKELSLKSGIGVTTLHHLINDSKATEYTIEVVANCLVSDFNKDIDDRTISSMIKIVK